MMLLLDFVACRRAKLPRPAEKKRARIAAVPCAIAALVWQRM
jgi:hypothetical protein